ncbi:hypothetical protein Hdeb2414_s0010g00340271 [Helianthus debilis subsp. tardiflorus]
MGIRVLSGVQFLEVLVYLLPLCNEDTGPVTPALIFRGVTGFTPGLTISFLVLRKFKENFHQKWGFHSWFGIILLICSENSKMNMNVMNKISTSQAIWSGFYGFHT